VGVFKIKIRAPKIKWNPIKDIGRVGNAINAGLSSLESGVRRDVAAVGRNIETNTQRTLNSFLSLTSPGGLNNLGNTLLQFGAMGQGGIFANPNDLKQVTGDINIDRMAKDAQAKVEKEIQRDQQALIDARNQEVSSFLSQMTDQRRRQPGRSQTILGGSSSTPNTLLTMLR